MLGDVMWGRCVTDRACGVSVTAARLCFDRHHRPMDRPHGFCFNSPDPGRRAAASPPRSRGSDDSFAAHGSPRECPFMRIITPLLVVAGMAAATGPAAAQNRLPSLRADRWVNSAPLSPERLRGQVVLVDVWEYTCINW